MHSHDVLIIVNGVVQDPRDPTGWLGLRMKSIFAQIENTVRVTRIQSAIKANLERGIVSTPPTVGYVLDGKRSRGWIKDPRPRVRKSIEAIHRIFREEGSCPRTVRRMIELGVK